MGCLLKHARAAAIHHNITGLFAYSVNKSSAGCKRDGDLKELITTYKKSCFSLLNKARLFRHYFQQFRKIKAVDVGMPCLSNKTILAYLLSIIYNKPLIISDIGLHHHPISFVDKVLMNWFLKELKRYFLFQF